MSANTLLLLHGEDIVDSSAYGRSITNHGVTVTDAQSKFGGKSMYFDGSASRLEVQNLLSGSGEFTVECWAYPLTTKNNTVWSHGGTNVAQITGGGVEMFGDGTLLYYCNGFLIHSGQYTLNEWQHIALVGDQNTIKLYHNGILVGTYNGAHNFGAYVEDIGANASAYGGENFHGYIDEFRISDVVRWAENFNPPTAPYGEEETPEPDPDLPPELPTELDLITDRTSADVLARNEKGTYGAEDLNRVGLAMLFVADRLRKAGYDPHINPKTNWTDTEWPTPSDMEQYLLNLAELRSVFTQIASTPDVPSDMEKLKYSEANDIEQILLNTDGLLTNIAASWFYSEEIFAGEV